MCAEGKKVNEIGGRRWLEFPIINFLFDFIIFLIAGQVPASAVSVIRHACPSHDSGKGQECFSNANILVIERMHFSAQYIYYGRDAFVAPREMSCGRHPRDLICAVATLEPELVFFISAEE